MSTAIIPSTHTADALAERIFDATLTTIELGCVYVGVRGGLYGALRDGGAQTSAQVAARAGADERYVREWLEQQAAADILAVDDVAAPAGARRYTLPDGHAEALLEPESPAASSGFALLGVGCLLPIDQLVEAFRTGAGVPYPAYGAAARDGIAAANRPMFVNELASSWLPAAPEVDARLRATPPARVADLACGTGWSSIAIARGYPDARVDGYDLDEDSIEDARRNVAAAGLSDRVRVAVQDASDPALEGTYDLVTIFEALHDMAHPVEALRTARRMLVPGGSVIIGDERVAERFTAPAEPLDRLNYAFSVLHCLAVGRTEPDSAETGTVMRPDTLRAYAAEAGFGQIEILPVEHDFWWFYRLRG